VKPGRSRGTLHNLVDSELTELLEDLYRRGRDHDESQADRLDRWRNLEPDSARMLALLVRVCAPHLLLELGTSNGYSTIWLADAARAVGGSLTSVEIDPARVAEARANLSRAGLEDFVELRTEDACTTLAGSADTEWDLVFLDAERPAYVSYWPDLVRILRPRGLLAVDNVVSHAAEVAAFRELVAEDARVMEAVVPTGAGVLLAVRVGI
jgi:predicted O-methyltransferase YrrM